jgi:hypothetical protein
MKDVRVSLIAFGINVRAAGDDVRHGAKPDNYAVLTILHTRIYLDQVKINPTVSRA